MSNQIIKYMWTEGELWDGSLSIFHLLFFLFSQIYNLSFYHLHLPSCALANYHPLLTNVLLPVITLIEMMYLTH